MTPPEITVVVPTCQRADRLPRLVDALAAQDLDVARWDAVIVDDSSTDSTAATLQRLRAEVPFRLRAERTPQRSGPALARNVAWRSSEAAFFAFTDDDCVPGPGWLRAGLEALREDHRIGVVQGRTVAAEFDREHRHPRTVVREVLEPSPWFEGCNLFLRREALIAGGGFDEEIGWFGEETALGWAVVTSGWERGWAPDAVVTHDVEQRPWRWHLRNHWLNGNTVLIASRYPAIRSWFWRPWAVSRENATFALAVAGAVAATRWRPAALLALPYLRWAPEPWRGRREMEAMAYEVSCYGAALAGKLVAGAKTRTFVL